MKIRTFACVVFFFSLSICVAAQEKVITLIEKVIPEEFLQKVHQQWMDESEKGSFSLKHLKVPEKIKEVKIISAFPLTDQQQSNLKKKLKNSINSNGAIKIETDRSLIVGFVIAIGSVVVDVSLKHKILKEMQKLYGQG